MSKDEIEEFVKAHHVPEVYQEELRAAILANGHKMY